MPIKLANNASGTLATAISASDIGIALTTGDGAEFPTLGAGDYFYATLTSTAGTQEIVKATARSGDSLTVVRAQEGTVAQSFAAGARFELRVTVQSVRDWAEVYTPAGAGAVVRTVEAKLRETVSVKDFGAVGDGVTDDTVAIQAAFDFASGNDRTLFVPSGVYLVSTAITINVANFFRFSLFGAGAKSSILRQTNPNEHCLSRISGNMEIAISDISFEVASAGTGKALYLSGLNSSAIKNVNAFGGAEGVYCPGSFSNTFENVTASSYTSDAFYVGGLVTCTLINCYAQTVPVGKSGYVINGSAELIGCNGCNVVGGFRASNIVRVIGITSRVVLTNCNFEDYGDYGIRFDSGSINATVTSCTWIPGTSTTDIAPVYFASMQGVPPLFVNNNFLTGSGSAGEAFVSNSDAFAIVPVVIGATSVIGLRVKGPTLTYNVAAETVESAVFLGFAKKFDFLTCNRFIGFIAQVPQTWTANSSTFDVAGKNLVRTANTIAINFNQATGGTIDGHRLTIMVNDANTTIKHDVGGVGRFKNSSGADIVAVSGKVYEYVYHNSLWWQVGG